MADAKALVVLVHGFGHHMDHLHDHIAGQYSQRGIAVVGFDQAGHGRSEGTPSYVPDVADVSRDVIQLTRNQPEAEQSIPIFLQAESMGAAVSLLAVEMEPTLFAGAILIAPLLGIGQFFVLWSDAFFCGPSLEPSAAWRAEFCPLQMKACARIGSSSNFSGCSRS